MAFRNTSKMATVDVQTFLDSKKNVEDVELAQKWSMLSQIYHKKYVMSDWVKEQTTVYPNAARCTNTAPPPWFTQHAPDCCTNAKLFVRCVSITHNDSVFLRETSDVCLLVCLYRLWHQLTLELLQFVHHSCFKAGGRLEVCVYMNVQIYVCSKFHFQCGQTIEVFLCFHSFCSSTIISLLTSNQSMSHDSHMTSYTQ